MTFAAGRPAVQLCHARTVTGRTVVARAGRPVVTAVVAVVATVAAALTVVGCGSPTGSRSARQPAGASTAGPGTARGPAGGPTLSVPPPPAPTVLTPGPAPPGSTRGLTVPVLLVHGYGGGAGDVTGWARRLSTAGRSVVLVPLRLSGYAPIAASAAAVDAAARRVGTAQVDAVGFSLGGLVIREWARVRRPDAPGLRRAALVGTPNAGVDVGAGPGGCRADLACGQLRPGSAYLRGLSADPRAAGRPGWLTVASPGDRLVGPPAGVALPGAVNVVVTDVCPGRAPGHGELTTEPVIAGVLVELVTAGVRTAPRPADCGRLTALGRS
jgi:triacylglycerol lipase